MTAQDYKAPESVRRLETRALIVGIVGLIVCVIGWIKSPANFFHAYLIALMLVLGVSLGSMGILMLQHLTGGHWGIIIRRPLEAATRVLWLVALFFIPIVFGMTYLYSGDGVHPGDRKSTRLNSSHPSISYAVFCLKKKKYKKHLYNKTCDIK